MRFLVKFCSVFLCLALSAFSAKAFANDLLSLEDTSRFEFKYQVGKIDIKDGFSTLNLSKKYRFLDSKQTRIVLEALWGNPPDSSVLGMIVPADIAPTDSNSRGVVITYLNDGHVDDEDADNINYDDLLKEMQKSSEEENKRRKKEGYEGLTLIGWASKPFYDKENKKLHWAKEFMTDKDSIRVLNYDVRILGRKGLLSLNAVASMQDLKIVSNEMQDLLKSVEFNEGNKYSEFDPDVDEVAAYGISGLIAGKVLAKAGFWALILKFIKHIGIGLFVALAASWKWIKKLFIRGKKEE